MVKCTEEGFKKKIENIHNITKEDYTLLSEYLGWDKPITIKCNRCGTIMTKNGNSFTSKKVKSFCRCYNQSENWLLIKKDFEKWKENQKDYNILEDFKGIRVSLKVICLKCNGTQNRTPLSLIKGDGCLICENKHSIKKTTEFFQKELNNLYGEEYTVIEEYKGADTPILIRHNICNKIYKVKPHNILTNKGGHCPICKIKSKGEKRIQRFLEKNNIIFEEQKRIDIIKQMPFDFYLPKYNLLIEYQGQQHFFPVEKFGGEESYKKQVKNDKIKKEIALKQKFNYLTIKYTDYEQIESLLAQRLSEME